MHFYLQRLGNTVKSREQQIPALHRRNALLQTQFANQATLAPTSPSQLPGAQSLPVDVDLSSSMTKPDALRRRPRPRVSEDFVRVVAQSRSEILPLQADVPRMIANDAEYRLRDLIQHAKSFMVHSKRTRLSVDDVAAALRSRKGDPVIGLGLGAPSKKVEGVEGVYVRKDEVVKLDELITKELPEADAEVCVEPGWVVLEGEQVMENGRIRGGAKKLSSRYVRCHFGF